MLRHCTISELLELRDRETSAAVIAHVQSCRECRDKLDRLYQRRAALRALPSLRPPRDRWKVVREAHVADRRRALRVRLLWGGLAAAAVIVLAVGIQSAATDRPGAAFEQAGLEALVRESQRLEEVLRAVRSERRVMDGYTATAVAELEDRLAALDAGISLAQDERLAPAYLHALWRERVTLMGALVNTHVARVSYVGF